MPNATIRVYGPLNDFVPPDRRQLPWQRTADGHTSVKDLVESVGVPHPEIDLILVNGTSVSFEYVVRDGDHIAVFPPFRTFDISTVTRVRPRSLETIRFIADVHLGRLVRRLRLAGLDTAYRNDADDATLAEQASHEGRILLTRDQDLLKRRVVTHGYYVRATHPHQQFVELLRRFGPLPLQPFTRCLRCNEMLALVPKSAVEEMLPARTRQHFDRFDRCTGCGHLYWRGSHWARLVHAIDAARTEAEGRSL